MKEFLASLDWMTLLSAIWTVILVPVGTQFYKYLQSKKLDKYGVILYEEVKKAVKSVYEKQYGLYIAMLRQFNVERERTGEPLYKVGDKFEMAYTVLQRESIKSFADESFGYYDLETKAE